MHHARLSLASPLHEWHFCFLVTKLGCSFSKTFVGVEFCEWAEQQGPIEREQSILLGTKLVERCFFKLLNEARHFSLQASCKATHILVGNPFRMEEVVDALASADIAKLVVIVASEAMDVTLCSCMLNYLFDRGLDPVKIFDTSFVSSLKNVVVFVQALLLSCLPSIKKSVLLLATSTLPFISYLSSSSDPLLSEANALNIAELLILASNNLASSLTTCPADMLEVLWTFRATLSECCRGRPDALFQQGFARMFEEAWMVEGLTPSSRVEMERLCHLIVDSWRPGFQFQLLSPEKEKSVLLQLKQPCSIINSFFDGSFANTINMLTARRASLPSDGASPFHHLTPLVHAMTVHAHTLMVVERSRPFRSNVQMNSICETLKLIGLLQQFGKLCDGLEKKKGQALAKGHLQARKRVSRARAVSQPRCTIGFLPHHQSEHIIMIDERWGTWSLPLCRCCLHIAQSFADLVCAKCSTSLRGRTPLLTKVIVGMNYEVGHYQVSNGAVPSLPVQLFVMPSRFVGTQLLEMARGIVLYMCVCKDISAEPLLMCAVPEEYPSSAETVFVLSQTGFSRYRRSSSNTVPLEVSGRTLIPVMNPNVLKVFQEYVLKSAQRNFKFGVLYMAEGQQTEMQLYANNDPGSVQYTDFLSLLGKRVLLAFHQGYTGGLKNSACQYSIFSQIRVNVRSGFLKEKQQDDDATNMHTTMSIMWHVATMMTNNIEDSAQCLERKRHIGNDVVVIVFREYGTQTPFVPRFVSHFNHVFIVVQPSGIDDEGTPTSYFVQCVAKNGVPSFPPFVSCDRHNSVARKDLGDFLILKCINGEHAALEAPVFYERLKAPWIAFLQEFVTSNLTKKTSLVI